MDGRYYCTLARESNFLDTAARWRAVYVKSAIRQTPDNIGKSAQVEKTEYNAGVILLEIYFCLNQIGDPQILRTC